jgi:(heptosyl)LPS beta-1,4-glucosyltransferase
VGLARRLLAPVWVFFSTYLLRLGVLDGYQGFLIARMAARYVSRKYDKWEKLRGGSAAELDKR